MRQGQRGYRRCARVAERLRAGIQGAPRGYHIVNQQHAAAGQRGRRHERMSDIVEAHLPAAPNLGLASPATDDRSLKQWPAKLPMKRRCKKFRLVEPPKKILAAVKRHGDYAVKVRPRNPAVLQMKNVPLEDSG